MHDDDRRMKRALARLAGFHAGLALVILAVVMSVDALLGVPPEELDAGLASAPVDMLGQRVLTDPPTSRSTGLRPGLAGAGCDGQAEGCPALALALGRSGPRSD